jgi:DNA polymerase III epsilon subunit-like protein
MANTNEAAPAADGGTAVAAAGTKLAPDYSGNPVDTSNKDYSYEPAQFPLLVMLARMLGKDLFIYDLETTNLLEDPQFGIAELGMMRVSQKDGKVRVNGRYFNPGFPMGEIASKVTGITDAMLADKESYGKKHADFVNQVAQSCLVITFNGRNFDIPGMFKEHDRYGFEQPFFTDVLDVREIWTTMTGKPNGKLVDVLAYYHLEPLEAHRADADVVMTAMALEAMLWRHGVDAVMSCRVTDDGTDAGDLPKALSQTFVLKHRLTTYFNDGNMWEGIPVLAKALQLNEEEARQADFELSNLIRDRKVPPEAFKKAVVQEFIAKHLDSVCAKENVSKHDPSIRIKPIFDAIKKVRGCPKDLDYIQLRAALASLPVEEVAPVAAVA